MSQRLWKNSTGQTQEFWLVLLLLVVVAVPTLGVLWFASIAMENQQLATRQRLADVYRSQLQGIQKKIEADWQSHSADIDAILNTGPHPASFFDLVSNDLVDSAVFVGSNNEIEYPDIERIEVAFEPTDPRWGQASLFENPDATGKTDLRTARKIYAAIAAETQSKEEQLKAIQAQVRCSLNLDRNEEATLIVTRSLTDGTFDSLDRTETRSIAANLLLIAIGNLPIEQTEAVIGRFREIVEDYRHHPLSSSQRLFLMKQLEETTPGIVNPRLRRAEDWANSFPRLKGNLDQSTFQRSELPGIWYIASRDKRAVLLFERQTIMQLCARSIDSLAPMSDGKIDVIPPGSDSSTFVSIPARKPPSGLATSRRTEPSAAKCRSRTQPHSIVDRHACRLVLFDFGGVYCSRFPASDSACQP